MQDMYATATVRTEQLLIDGQPKELIVKVPLIIHPNRQSNKIVIIYPGYNGNADGYSEKYRKIADHLVERGVGAVIRMENKPIDGLSYPSSLVANLDAAIEYAVEEKSHFCGKGATSIYLMGTSAGGSAVAAVCANWGTLVPKILLLAPSGDARGAVANLGNYRGDVYIAVGEKDEVVGKDAGQRFFDLALNASSRHLEVIPE